MNINNIAWFTAIGVFLVGDIFTTYVGLSHSLMYEQNPYASNWYQSYGLVSMILILSGLKCVVLLFGYYGFLYMNGFHKYGIPLAFIITGGFATLWNSYLIFTEII